MVSLDSSFLIDLLAGDRPAVAKAYELDKSAEPRWLTPPVAAEVLVGAYLAGGTYFARAKLLVDGLPLLPFDRAACHESGRLAAELIARGTALGQADLFIAAITRWHGERLLTRDRAFGKVPGLAVEGY